MAVTRRAKISRRWPGEKSIFWEAWDERRCQVERQRRTAFRRARSSISPKRIVISVQKASCCGRKDASTARRSGVSWPIATKLKSATAQPCIRKPECCPENQSHGRGLLRRVENIAVLAFREKMASREAQAQYRRRSQVAEFCHAWIKSKLGLRQFHVRGLAKVQIEMLWACLTYNLQHWIRLSKLRAAPTTT